MKTGLTTSVQANPSAERVGCEVNVLGDNLTSTTNVMFNGKSATFRFVSDTYIRARVPSGATTGTIQITTPSGTLKSNVAFQVLR